MKMCCEIHQIQQMNISMNFDGFRHFQGRRLGDEECALLMKFPSCTDPQDPTDPSVFYSSV